MNGANEAEGEHIELHVEKEEDDEEIQSRNEVSFAINDYNADYNRNKQITLKSKEKDVDELIKIAIDALKTEFYKKDNGKKEEKMFG